MALWLDRLSGGAGVGDGPGASIRTPVHGQPAARWRFWQPHVGAGPEAAYTKLLFVLWLYFELQQSTQI